MNATAIASGAIASRGSTAPGSQPGGRLAERRLAGSRVLVVGAGALGSPAAAHLATAGVGTIGIVDPDRVELSNLHRQLLHGTADLGRPKVASARERLQRHVPELTVEAIQARVGTANAAPLFARYDFIIDCTDGFPAKFLINDAALQVGTPFSHAGVQGFLGQTLTVLPGRSACYRCVFTAPPPDGAVPSCREAGVLGPVAAIIGTIQATQAVAYLLGSPSLLVDRLLTYDALRTRWRQVRLARNPSCPACAAIDRPSAHERPAHREGALS